MQLELFREALRPDMDYLTYDEGTCAIDYHGLYSWKGLVFALWSTDDGKHWELIEYTTGVSVNNAVDNCERAEAVGRLVSLLELRNVDYWREAVARLGKLNAVTLNVAILPELEAIAAMPKTPEVPKTLLEVCKDEGFFYPEQIADERLMKTLEIAAERFLWNYGYALGWCLHEWLTVGRDHQGNQYAWLVGEWAVNLATGEELSPEEMRELEEVETYPDEATQAIIEARDWHDYYGLKKPWETPEAQAEIKKYQEVAA